jgi:hypothetical protein
MTRVDRDKEDGILAEKLNCGFDRGECSGAHRCDGLIATGEVAKVEHSCLYGLFNVVFDIVVAIVNERIVIGAACSRKIFARGFNGTCLNVKGINSSALAHCFGQKLGIVAVSHSKIDRGITLVQVFKYEFFVQIKKLYNYYSPFLYQKVLKKLILCAKIII